MANYPGIPNFMLAHNFNIVQPFTFVSQDLPHFLPVSKVVYECTDLNTVDEDYDGKLFPKRLRGLLNEKSLNHIIRWSEDGKSLVIPCENAFYTSILHRRKHKFFKTESLRSFYRQLNLYGFNKIKASQLESDANETIDTAFHHPYFLRDKPELIDYVKRRIKAKKGGDEKSFQRLKKCNMSPKPYMETLAGTEGRRSKFLRAGKRGSGGTICELYEGQSFPYRLYHLLAQNSPDICWSENGQFVEIPNHLSFYRNVLLRKSGKIFKTESLKSFVRQLNLYGFKKIHPEKEEYHVEMAKKDEDTYSPESVFRHVSFMRDRADLLHLVKRRCNVKNSPTHYKTQRFSLQPNDEQLMQIYQSTSTIHSPTNAVTKSLVHLPSPPLLKIPPSIPNSPVLPPQRQEETSFPMATYQNCSTPQQQQYILYEPLRTEQQYVSLVQPLLPTPALPPNKELVTGSSHETVNIVVEEEKSYASPEPVCMDERQHSLSEDDSYYNECHRLLFDLKIEAFAIPTFSFAS